VELDARSEKVGYKIREAQLQKIPYMLIIGDKEVQSRSVALRSREEGDLGPVTIESFLSKFQGAGPAC
ncbi:MAG: His/Gly/Thr/Pro-type tRNA ligase C-terminal domain-containing protein, partial [Dethiobacteria bacterium]|jgi:threonyl-tRNA synthetase